MLLVTLAASTPDVAAAAAHGYVRTVEVMVRRAARASTELALVSQRVRAHYKGYIRA